MDETEPGRDFKGGDRWNLRRFVEAQDEVVDGAATAGGRPTTVIELALRELDAGAKRTHWMWFVFPQFPLGMSETARFYALSGADEACAHLAHPVLGGRLRASFEVVARQLDARGVNPEELFGSHVDCLKFASSATLFELVADRVGDAALAVTVRRALEQMTRHGFGRCGHTVAHWR